MLVHTPILSDTEISQQLKVTKNTLSVWKTKDELFKAAWAEEQAKKTAIIQESIEAAYKMSFPEFMSVCMEASRRELEDGSRARAALLAIGTDPATDKADAGQRIESLAEILKSGGKSTTKAMELVFGAHKPPEDKDKKADSESTQGQGAGGEGYDTPSNPLRGLVMGTAEEMRQVFRDLPAEDIKQLGGEYILSILDVDKRARLEADRRRAEILLAEKQGGNGINNNN